MTTINQKQNKEYSSGMGEINIKATVFINPETFTGYLGLKVSSGAGDKINTAVKVLEEVVRTALKEASKNKELKDLDLEIKVED